MKTQQPAPTPETDATWPGHKSCDIDFARKLERERDEARLLNSAQGEYDIVAERNQLRKVADELATHARHADNCDFYLEGDQRDCTCGKTKALAAYNELQSHYAPYRHETA